MQLLQLSPCHGTYPPNHLPSRTAHGMRPPTYPQTLLAASILSRFAPDRALRPLPLLLRPKAAARCSSLTRLLCQGGSVPLRGFL